MIRLSGIDIQRAGNGFIVRLSKTNPSAKREWTSYTKVFLTAEDALNYLTVQIQAWEPASREGSI